MLASTRTLLALGTVVLGASVVCPLGVESAHARPVQGTAASVQAADTATVRLHISGMTCGSCPVTARLALQKIPGVYSAKVTLDDSLGVVRYDPRRVTSDSIAARLSRVTDYRATVLSAVAKPPRSPRG
jgi:mercuric ion binding protein